MGKLYKVEYDESDWKQIIRLLDGCIDSLEAQIEAAKKEGGSLAEVLVKLTGITESLVKDYKFDILRQLKEQSYTSPKHIT